MIVAMATASLNLTNEEINYDDVIKTSFNTDKQRLETLVKFDSGGWFVYDAVPSCRLEDYFHGIWDFWTGVGWNMIISERPYRAINNGGASWVALNQSYGGVRMSTAAITGRYAAFGTGDDNGFVHTFNAQNNISFHIDFRSFTNTNEISFGGLYNNWSGAFIGIRLNTSVDGNWYFVTNDSSAETTTSLGASDTDWHKIWFEINETSAQLSIDGSSRITHSTNIPTDDLMPYLYIETLENVAKSIDIRHFVILQDCSGI